MTTSLVALTFIGDRTEFRRALGPSTVHDFYNWLALLLFFPIELIWHPLEHISGTLTNALYGTGWLPNPAHFNFIRAATRPVEHGVIHATSHVSSTLGPLFTIVIGAAPILIAVRYLGRLLKLLMVGQGPRRSDQGRRPQRLPRHGVRHGSNRPYPVIDHHHVGAGPLRRSRHPDTGTGVSRRRRLQPRHNVHGGVRGVRRRRTGREDRPAGNLRASALQPLRDRRDLRDTAPHPVPLFCAQNLARIASEHRWVLAVYLGTVFIALPALVIVLVGVL